MTEKTIILNGARFEDKHLDSINTLLTDEIHKHHGGRVRTFMLRDIKIKPCTGCFNCWIKTPGRCIHADAGPDILREILNSDTVILFTPVVFGGYSSELKKIADRFLPIVLPFFRKIHGETHHPPRYSKFPRFIGLGVSPHPRKELSHCFKTLVGRNALNLPPSYYTYIAEVLDSTESSKVLREQLRNLLFRKDKLPLREKFTLSIQNTSSELEVWTGSRKALLVTGSQKTGQTSTSAVLGKNLLGRLKKHGWATETLKLTENLLREERLCDLYSAVDRADTILIAFPLYFDTLPFMMTKLFEIIACHRKKVKNSRPKRIIAVVNNALPEAHQNMVALAVCRNFAMECGMSWAGSLAMGSGEALVSGQSLTGFTGFKGLKRPPLYYVVRALNMTAAALAEGHPVPEKAAQLIAKKPVPCIPFNLWRWMYIKIAKRLWEKAAFKNGLNRKEMLGRPYVK